MKEDSTVDRLTSHPGIEEDKEQILLNHQREKLAASLLVTSGSTVDRNPAKEPVPEPWVGEETSVLKSDDDECDVDEVYSSTGITGTISSFISEKMGELVIQSGVHNPDLVLFHVDQARTFFCNSIL